MVFMLAIQWDLVYAIFKPQHYAFWVWLIAGLTGATLSFRFWDLGVTLTGALGGFAIAMGIIAIANLSIGNAGRYVILGVMILGGAAIATFFERVFIICGTSCGGAYMVMFGVDQFAQVGYREMIVIFDFSGKTFIYHPTLQVYLMLGSSLVLAGIGIAWEFWHHKKPLLMDRKAVFRIYGRPFGKRPRKLVGQRIHRHLKTRSDVYAYILGCYCLQKRTIEDVLYDDDCCDPGVNRPEPSQNPVTGEQPSPISEGQDIPSTKEPKTTTPSDSSDTPLTTVPIEDSEEKHTDASDHILSEVVTDVPHTDSSQSGAHPDHQQDSETADVIPSDAERKDTENHSIGLIIDSEDAGPSSSIAPTRPYPSGPHHPLFSPNLGPRTVQLIRLVSDDTSPGNTIPREFFPEGSHARPGPHTPSSLWPLSSPSTSDMGSRTSLLPTHGLHMLEVSEGSQGSNEPWDDEELVQSENGDAPLRPRIVFQEILDK
ncbi:hypothetical protein BGZ65_000342 [Modicella reniformis]|uniref:Transmembrane protein 198 n=1 Tax=Modicella reniformis TaxID=1440133 RepID=A0A9P6MJR2_9FUNG|nr:hypothetical protein BGZ65_000342 [Modicella reniformis]